MKAIIPSEHAPRERVVLPKITLAMLICGIVGAAAATTAGAAGSDTDAPAIAVKYDPTTLDSDGGARQLYARIVNAAAEVCPEYESPHWVTHAVQVCRDHAIAGAVAKVHHPKLVAIYRSNSKNG